MRDASWFCASDFRCTCATKSGTVREVTSSGLYENKKQEEARFVGECEKKIRIGIAEERRPVPLQPPQPWYGYFGVSVGSQVAASQQPVASKKLSQHTVAPQKFCNLVVRSPFVPRFTVNKTCPDSGRLCCARAAAAGRRWRACRRMYQHSHHPSSS